MIDDALDVFGYVSIYFVSVKVKRPTRGDFGDSFAIITRNVSSLSSSRPSHEGNAKERYLFGRCGDILASLTLIKSILLDGMMANLIILHGQSFSTTSIT